MVKRLITLTASAVITLAIAASAADSDNTAPVADTAGAPHVIALQQLDNARIDAAVAKLEATIEKLRAAEDTEGFNKDEVIAQLEAAAESLRAQEPQLLQLKQHLLELKAPLGELGALREHSLSPESIEELKNHALNMKELAPGEGPHVFTWQQFQEKHPGALAPEALEELTALPEHFKMFQFREGDAPDAQRFEELRQLKQFEQGQAPFAYTPQQIEELKEHAKAMAGQDGSKFYYHAPFAPGLHEQIGQLVHGQQLSEAEVAELKAQIKALVEQYVDEHAGDDSDTDDNC